MLRQRISSLPAESVASVALVAEQNSQGVMQIEVIP